MPELARDSAAEPGTCPNLPGLSGGDPDRKPGRRRADARTRSTSGGPYPDSLLGHPDVWVTWHDAATYAVWCGKLLPNSGRWERAARGLLGYEAGLILGEPTHPLLHEA
ncbi:SUMF1/EgtB/PvdO family nonheme iron enzyme [Streptomyces sp. NPDC005393]|uniref:SUMF1/EgtB/PvdO family nonheme iron enzyme n=1 Tax=Streptomyces sp. NPDC005393 TaxID=3157041 RepID=UPI0033A870D4